MSGKARHHAGSIGVAVRDAAEKADGEVGMNEQSVRIVRLDPMRVASVLGFGANPEHLAWKKLREWAEPRGYFTDRQAHRIFGFNNPNPSPGSPNYGYELWMTVGPKVAADDQVSLAEFGGGLYAVTRCKSVAAIRAAWCRLGEWCERSRYTVAGHQWLEESVGEVSPLVSEQEVVLDLHLPVMG
jgi:DNA gyrase inhibitor GyrI